MIKIKNYTIVEAESSRMSSRFISKTQLIASIINTVEWCNVPCHSQLYGYSWETWRMLFFQVLRRVL